MAAPELRSHGNRERVHSRPFEMFTSSIAADKSSIAVSLKTWKVGKRGEHIYFDLEPKKQKK